jgi:RHS repeat-associated protein
VVADPGRQQFGQRHARELHRLRRLRQPDQPSRRHGESRGLLNSSGGSTTTSAFGFGASYNDQSNLNYLVNRYYDPTSGQFVSVDPLLSQTQQPFEYAGDNPVMAVDPNGQATLGVCGGIAGEIELLVGGGVSGSVCAYSIGQGFFGNTKDLYLSETYGLSAVGIGIGGM